MTASPRPLLREPAAREKKPEYTDLPPGITRQIESLVKARITGADYAFGGLSASAAYIFTLDGGRRIFAKGAHPGDTSHGAKNLAQEIFVYESLDVVRRVSPPYIGLVSDGMEDGWMLGVWDCVEHHPALASPARVIASLKEWQRDAAAKELLPPARGHVYISQLMSPEKKWLRLRSDAGLREKFLGLFAEPAAGKKWFDKNIGALALQQGRASRMALESGLLHGDLRLDNFLFGRERTWVIDWPNACHGPVLFDLVFLSSNMEALGLGRAEEFFAGYADAGGGAFSDDAKGALLSALSGYFADQAYRAPPEKMPRLRWMQQSMLLAQLKILGRLGIIESPPPFAGENQ